MRPLLAFLFLLIGINFCSAQINETFADSNFSTNPVWVGDSLEFIVNNGLQLQLNSSQADTSYLVTSSNTLANTEWQFWVRLNFAPSDNNMARFYLAADATAINNSVNGYYIRLGENGSFDSIDLWVQSGNMHTKIVDGIPAHCAASNNVLRIKVTRDNNGLWTVYSDTTGGTNFSLEGTAFDITHTSSSYIGVSCQYTSSNTGNFYFDDITVASIPTLPDTTAPQIVSAIPTAVNALDVLFNEAIDIATAQNIANYTVDNGIGTPTSAIRDASNFTLVHLAFSANFTPTTSYSISITAVQDTVGNALLSGSALFTWNTPVVNAFRDLVLNEIMADPSPQIGLPDAEFVELFNKTNNPVNLSGWTFSDASSIATFPNYTLPANSYLILCATSDTVLFNPYGATLGLSNFPSLNNTGDGLWLYDTTGQVIDSLNYDLTWYHDGSKDDGGWTLELINPMSGSGCDVSANWGASMNSTGGTPGQQNSIFNATPDTTTPGLQTIYALDSNHILLCFNEAIPPQQLASPLNYLIDNGVGNPSSISSDSTQPFCVILSTNTAIIENLIYTITISNLFDCAGNSISSGTSTFIYHSIHPYDVVINELMIDPDPPQALPNAEYIELHNTKPYPIYLDGWQLSVDNSIKTLSNTWLPADSFLVLTDAGSATAFGAIAIEPINGFPSLLNTQGEILLRTKTGILMQHIQYNDSWYADPIRSNGGWSLEQIDPENPCAGAKNWKAAAANTGGTPGKRNSRWAINADQIPPKLLRATVLTPDSIRLFFSESIDSLSADNVQQYSISSASIQPIHAYPIGPSFTRVDLKLSAPLQPQIHYSVSVSNIIADCAGNLINTTNEVNIALPEPIAPGDIVINEVLADPYDGGVDFIEIVNRSQKVLDLKWILLCSEDTLVNAFVDISQIAPEGYLLFPGDYLVLSENGEIITSQYPANADRNRMLDLTTMLSLNIDGDIIVLIDTGYTPIDHLVYSADWHFPLLDDTKGVSLERIDTERPSQEATNWHSAAETAGFATPTKENSQYSPSNIDDGAVNLSNTIFSPDNDGIDDVVTINYAFDQPGYIANIAIYDSRGRLIRRLASNTLLGTEQGSFSWDGVQDDRSPAQSGVYVVYVEAFNTSGTVKRYKKACVLAARL